MTDRKLFYGIIDSIRNMRVLNDNQQEFVEKLSKEECYELLREYIIRRFHRSSIGYI